MNDGIPVTLLSGSLGAGKTTVVNYLLENSGGRSIAVLVNDMGEVNVDADLLAAGTDLADGGIAELSNGCICCELQDDLETEVARLASERDFDYLVVEASGISEPAPVARLFTTASRAAAAYRLDTLVTVVDADQFDQSFGNRERVERRTAPGSSDRPLSDLLVEQIEVSNVVLLNKADLVDEGALDHAEALIGVLAPDVTVIRTVHGTVDPGEILDTGRFDAKGFGNAAGWQHSSGSDHDHSHGEGDHHAHPDEVYGVTSVTYRRRRPFHPERFYAFLENLPASIVRSKGLFWVAGRDSTALFLGQAGANVRIEPYGPWLASLPEVERELYRENRPDVEWDDDHGDRRTELVFIGHDVGDELVDRLDDCLVTNEERVESLSVEPFPTVDDYSIEFAIR